MKLGELITAIGAAELRGRWSGDLQPRLRPPRGEPGTLFFCVPGQRRTGTTSPRAPSSAARRPRRRAAAGGGGAAGARLRRPRRDGADRLPLSRRSDGELRVAGITGTNGKTTTTFLLAHDPRAGRGPDGAAGHGEADRRGRRGRGGADDAGGDRPSGRLQRDAGRGRRGLCDGGLLARAVAAPHRRRSASRSRCSRT